MILKSIFVLHLFVCDSIGISFVNKEGLLGQNNDKPLYLKSLVEAGSITMFERQFRSSEDKQNQNETEINDHKSVGDKLRDFIDFSVNPCDNFFQFACGTFINKSGEPGEYVSAFTQQGPKVGEVIKSQLMKPIQKEDAVPLQKAKVLFQSCMDEESIERRGQKPILKFLKDHGGWPVLGSWDQTKFDFVKLLGETRKLIDDSGVIIGTAVVNDIGRGDGRYGLYITEPVLGQYRFFNVFPNHEVYQLGTDNLLNRAYEQLLIDIAVLFGADIETARRDMHDVLKFETELANTFLSEENRRLFGLRYEKISVFELSLKFPYFDWLKYLRIILSPVKISINFNTDVILFRSSYYNALGRILSRTSPRTLANYILFRAIKPMIPGLTQTLRYVYLRYLATVNGDPKPTLPERSVFCTGVVSGQMSWVTSRLYLEKTLKVENIVKVKEIDQYVRDSFNNLIQRSDWLTAETKKALCRKLALTKIDIGFPQDIFDNSFLENYYKSFYFHSNLFENLQEGVMENNKYNQKGLVRRPQIEWLLRPQLANAAHAYFRNYVEIPYASLNDPLFNISYSPSLNFGGIGFLIGHEYMHGFDVSGQFINGTAQLSNEWSDQSYRNFMHKADCLIKQYSKYYLPDVNVFVTNGNKTLNENLADVAGTSAAFYAYQKYKKERGILDDRVSDLPFSGDQLYFINVARLWCAKASSTFLRKFQLIDNHAYNRLRVVAVFQNSKEFADVFHCPKGSFMNPQTKCDFL